MSLKDMILSAEDLPKLKIKVPEWNCSVFVRSMNGLERSEYEERMREISKKKTADYRIIATYLFYVLVDENGERIFDDPEDIELLVKKNSTVLLRIFKTASRHNGMTADDIEESEKN